MRARPIPIALATLLITSAPAPAFFPNLDTYGTDVVTAPPGTYSIITAHDDSVLTVTSQTTADTMIRSWDNSHVIMDGATIRNGDAGAAHNSTFTMNAGTFLNPYGAADALATDDATFNLNGGTVPRIELKRRSIFNMNGGTNTGVTNARDSTEFHLRGGDLQDYLAASFGADIFIYAKDLGPNVPNGTTLYELGDLPDSTAYPGFRQLELDITFLDDSTTSFSFLAFDIDYPTSSNIWTGDLIFITVGAAPGDLNNDTLIDAVDIDLLTQAIRNATTDTTYDLNADTLINNDDLTHLITTILQTRPGDANLDQAVDLIDLSALAANFNTTAGWAQGNFNTDTTVDLIDLSLLASNFGSTPPTPTPTSLTILALACLQLTQRPIE
ncbi:hypothetical protein [Mucisphaera sp.]|uniref:hypothetical protein n=1 Tax=Mucisphaera sp. TaxID=2913024 RepID=UPI003D0B9AA7